MGDPLASVDAFTKESLMKILSATKLSNSLPGDKRDEFDYYSTFSGFRAVMKSEDTLIKQMIQKHLDFHGLKEKMNSSHSADLLDTLTEINDAVLERVNMNLDEAAGVNNKDANPLLLEVSFSNVNRVAGSWNNFDRSKKNADSTSKTDDEVVLLTAKNVQRPQIRFKQFIDNSLNPFMPRIKDKPHSSKPLSILVEYDENGQEFYSHPYQFEIEHFTPQGDMMEESALPPTRYITEVPLFYVDTTEKLSTAVAELSKETIIGIDLEAHSYRSYLGITCLIQISSGSKDYIIDPFPLWADMTVLNEITADPKIVKVLHGSDKDVEWLQRDFSVYIVNSFDTFQAGKLLSFPRLSLAWLLEHYFDIKADKKFQLADWRIRPLPKEMVDYARMDTRHLIGLYARLKNELLEKGNEQKNLLLAAYQNSNFVCAKRFCKPLTQNDNYMNVVKKLKVTLNNKQQYALREIYNWRDHVAREEDESVNYILPNHMLLKICTELPREMQGILACCNPVPPLVKQNLHALHMIIFQARNKPVLDVGASAQNDGQPDAQQSETDDQQLNENPLKCPMELANLAEVNLNLKTVFNKLEKKLLFKRSDLSGGTTRLKAKPDLKFIGEDHDRRKQLTKGIQPFSSPYERFLSLKPFLDSLKAQETAQKTAASQSSTDLHIESIRMLFQSNPDSDPKAGKENGRNSKGSTQESIEEADIPMETSNGEQGAKKKKKKHSKDKSDASEETIQQPEEGLAVKGSKVKKQHKNGGDGAKLKRKLPADQIESDASNAKVGKQSSDTAADFDFQAVDYNKMFAAPRGGGVSQAEFNPNKPSKPKSMGPKKGKKRR